MTKTIKVEIENGYGILNFTHNFEFDDKSNFYGLYAQNGTMKSSFAKTLDDYSKGLSISDHLFPVGGDCNVTGVTRENILSFPSFDGRVEICDEAESLVANSEVKQKYDSALKEVEAAYGIFVERVAVATQTEHSNNISGLVDGMYRTFVSKEDVEEITIQSVVQLLKSISPEIKKGNSLFCDISYNRFIGLNFKKFIANKKYQGFFKELAKAYDEFRETPTYYRKGFDASSAYKLIKAIEDSKYFAADHTVALKNKEGIVEQPITSKEELELRLKTDFDLIIEQYPALKKPLEQLINDFSVGTNGDVRKIFEDKTKRPLLLYMGSESNFYKNMWYGYLNGCLEQVDALLTVYDDASGRIKEILDEAEDCPNEWEDIVKTFNDRFLDLPYKIYIVNKKDAIVHDLTRPVFEIRYRNPRNPADPYRERPDEFNRLATISGVLSNGERKALYLLNVIFRLRKKLKDGQDTLVVFDDIVESFDYKNKYAFFEYLQELASGDSNLFIIILTHNFDFYRLVYEKINPRKPEQFRIISRNEDQTLSVVDMFNPRVFGDMKLMANSDKSAWISLIPFARNLVEYKLGADNDLYRKLTKCLHIMEDELTILDIDSDIQDYTGVSNQLFSATQKVHDAIIETARDIANNSGDEFGLHTNITLAIGARLLMERYIITKISDAEYQSVLSKECNQTRELIKRYDNNVTDSNKQDRLKCFNKATMMVDGSIHLNSFMYEPLIDMGTWELKNIFKEVNSSCAP